jgi:hypothetical protein
MVRKHVINSAPTAFAIRGMAQLSGKIQQMQLIRSILAQGSFAFGQRLNRWINDGSEWTRSLCGTSDALEPGRS